MRRSSERELVPAPARQAPVPPRIARGRTGGSAGARRGAAINGCGVAFLIVVGIVGAVIYYHRDAGKKDGAIFDQHYTALVEKARQVVVTAPTREEASRALYEMRDQLDEMADDKLVFLNLAWSGTPDSEKGRLILGNRLATEYWAFPRWHPGHSGERTFTRWHGSSTGMVREMDVGLVTKDGKLAWLELATLATGP